MKHAPNFSLPDQNGVVRSLKDYEGHWLVLYFYPHDRSLNCTREACNFRDQYRVIAQFGGAQVIGVNKGSVASHKRFTDKHRLNFPILSDVGHGITSKYGAWRSSGAPIYDRAFGTRRNTYLIDPKGKIVKTYKNVDPGSHVEQIISDLQSLQSAN